MTDERMLRHDGRNIGTGMIDQWQCACGWLSNPYWDGDVWAENEWKAHAKAERLKQEKS